MTGFQPGITLHAPENAIAFTQFCDYLLKQIIIVTAGVMTTIK